jgi:hypothetical protein
MQFSRFSCALSGESSALQAIQIEMLMEKMLPPPLFIFSAVKL